MTKIVAEIAQTVAQRKAVMGHTNERHFDPYVAHEVIVDTQSGFLDRPLQRHTISRLRGMSLRRDIQAPKPKSASFQKKAAKHHSKVDRKEFEAEFSAHFQQSSAMHVALRDAAGNDCQPIRPNIESNVRPEPSKLLENVLRYHPARQKVISTLFPTTPSEPGLELTVEALLRLSQDNNRVARYPEVMLPDNEDYCPYCGRSFNKYVCL